MQNVECKCELLDAELARLMLTGIGAKPVGAFTQTDTFYHIPDGRLLRRETTGDAPEYLFYHRLNRVTPRLAHFTVYNEQEMRTRFGASPLPIRVVVHKTRVVWMLGEVVIHLDHVDGLGDFIEFVVLVRRDRHAGICHRAINEARRKLAPALGGMIATSYADMLADEMQDRPRLAPPHNPSEFPPAA